MMYRKYEQPGLTPEKSGSYNSFSILSTVSNSNFLGM